MASQDDIERATGGVANWNNWARERLANEEAPVADFSEAEIDGLNFEGFIFPGPAIFSRAKFYGRAIFSGAVFHSDARMDRIKFARDANFDKVKFKKSANFDHAIFCKFADFNCASFQELCMWGAEFEGEANFVDVRFIHAAFTGVSFKHVLTRFTDATFAHVPSFWAATFATPPLFERVEIPYVADPAANFWRRRMSCAAGAGDAARFRRLKQLASDWKDHERELEFFAKELRAMRFYETKSWHAIALNLAYGFFSDFGQSVWRPFLWLLGLTLFGAAISLLLEYWPMFAVMTERFCAAFVLSFTDATLLLGSDRWEIRRVACAALYGHPCKFGLGAGMLAYLQSAASLFLLFLLGLGLRNRFRAGST